MGTLARITILLITMVGCVGCDQLTKAAARAHLDPGQTVSLLNDALRLQHVENPGAFLSMGDALPPRVRSILFTLGGTVLVAGALLWAIFSRHMSPSMTIGAALACSGGIGNLIDRFTQDGHVTDFLNVGIGPLRTGIFNVADFALLLGVTIIVLSGGRDGRARSAS